MQASLASFQNSCSNGGIELRISGALVAKDDKSYKSLVTLELHDQIGRIGRRMLDEVQLTDAMSSLLKEEAIFAYPFQGRRYDCGNQMGLLEATIAYALKYPDLSARLREYLAQLSVEALV